MSLAVILFAMLCVVISKQCKSAKTTTRIELSEVDKKATRVEYWGVTDYYYTIEVE